MTCLPWIVLCNLGTCFLHPGYASDHSNNALIVLQSEIHAVNRVESNTSEPAASEDRASPNENVKPSFKPIELSPQIKETVRSIIKDQLIREMAKAGELESEGKYADHRYVKLGSKKITITTNFKGHVKLRFEEPDEKLKLTLKRLRQIDSMKYEFDLAMECPATGHAKASSELGGNIGSNFSTTIHLAIAGQISVSFENFTLNYKAAIEKVEPSLAGLSFSNDIINLFHGVAQKAVNNWAAKNQEKLKDKANKAIQKSIENAKLKGSLTPANAPASKSGGKTLPPPAAKQK